MKNQNRFMISDEVWQKVIQVVQLAMLTGTDVADYLRQITVVSEGNILKVDPDYEKLFEKTLADLTEKIVEKQHEQNKSKNSVLHLGASDDE